MYISSKPGRHERTTHVDLYACMQTVQPTSITFFFSHQRTAALRPTRDMSSIFEWDVWMDRRLAGPSHHQPCTTFTSGRLLIASRILPGAGSGINPLDRQGDIPVPFLLKVMGGKEHSDFVPPNWRNGDLGLLLCFPKLFSPRHRFWSLPV